MEDPHMNSKVAVQIILSGLLATGAPLLGHTETTSRVIAQVAPVVIQPQQSGAADPNLRPTPSAESMGAGIKTLAPRPAVDYPMSALPGSYPRPISEWQSTEKLAFANLLSAGRHDVLVVPFQVLNWAFSRGLRSAMTAQLVSAIARSGKVRIPDPHLVEKALGDGQRQLRPQDVYQLSDAMGVRRIVWGHVGHNRSGRMTIMISSQDRDQAAAKGTNWATPMSTYGIEQVGFGDENSPVQVFENLLPSVVKAVAPEAALPPQDQASRVVGTATLPATPMALLDGDDNPARNALVFLLLRQLTPEYLERTRERFAAKALVALMRLSPAAPEYRALRARTLMALGLRGAAITLLEVPRTDDERQVLAGLNGDLPAARAFATKEKNPLKQLVQQLDASAIASHYGVQNQTEAVAAVAALKLPGEIWPLIVTRSVLDDDLWAQFDNATLKHLLDLELPVKGYSLRDILGGSMPLGSDSKMRAAIDLSVVNHGRKWLETNSAHHCCERAFDRPGKLDFLELIQAIGHDNLIRRIKFLDTVQGQPDAALDFASSIDAVYKGFPYYVQVRSGTEMRRAESVEGAQKDGLRKAAYDNAVNALYWEQGQSLVSNAASAQYNRSTVNTHGRLGNLYHTDLPYHADYWTWADGGKRETLMANLIGALANATYQFNAFSHLASYFHQFLPGDARGELLYKSLDQRFIGAPQRNQLRARLALLNGDTKAAIAHFRENTRVAPKYWESFSDLGEMLVQSAAYDEASKVFMSYGGFKKDSGENRVAISNRAYEAGSLFYWAGHFEYATPLYSIAAGQGTGAASDLTSALRLKLLTGDIRGALDGSLARAQRYDDSYAYRDALGMLHALDQSTTAWDGFAQLVRGSGNPHVWETALVGHHRAGLSESEVAAWAGQDQFRDAGTIRNAAAIYLLRFATSDRTPSKDLPDLIDRLDKPIWRLEDYLGFVVRLTEDGSSGTILGPKQGQPKGSLPVGAYSGGKKHRVKSDLALFALAYRELKLGAFAQAAAGFAEAAKVYDMTSHALYMLPYYAWASAKAGDAAEVESIMRLIKPDDQKFDYQLAKSILAAAAGKKDDAMRALELARGRRPHTEARPLLTQITYGELAEQVAQVTGDDKIRMMALDWAQKAQKFEPWQSWSYGLEARLTRNPTERQRALAMAHYLDARSERLSKFDKSEVDGSVKAQGASNPFLKARSTGNAKGST
jgi:hypothetical protein